jgi:murein DD-endopeptidase MepM/ murein hydrolase activator NlpD
MRMHALMFALVFFVSNSCCSEIRISDVLLPDPVASEYDRYELDVTAHIFPASGRVSSGFGMRTNPMTGVRERHLGVDIAGKKGSIVVASMGGVVEYAGPGGGCGNLVVLGHGGGIETRYCHLDEILVRVGEVLYGGDALGRVGRSGLATGPHLHYEMMVGGVAVDPSPNLIF